MIIVKPKELTHSECKKPISNKLKIFFIIVQTIFAYDFGFIKYKSKRQKIIIKLTFSFISVALGCIYIYLISFEFTLLYLFWYSIFIFENYWYIFNLMIIPERNTFHKFLEHLLWIDFKVNSNNSFYYFEIKIILFCLASMMWRSALAIIGFIMYSEIYSTTIYTQILYLISFTSLDIPIIIFYFVFHATYIQLVSLRKYLKDKKFEPTQAQLLYKSLIDYVENIKNAFEPIFLVTLSANIPSMMYLIYEVIKDASVGLENLFQHSITSVTAVLFLVTIYAPAIAAGSLTTEVEKIKVFLHDMLLVVKDETQVEDIKRFISYLEARPFKFRVLKIIPLDASFPVMSLNVCVTYLIVILQLTHIY